VVTQSGEDYYGGGKPSMAVAGRPTLSSQTRGADEKLPVYSVADFEILAEVLKAAEAAASRELPGPIDAGQVEFPNTHKLLFIF
jgi:hypothetical protein